jgi:hypothetical protein
MAYSTDIDLLAESDLERLFFVTSDEMVRNADRRAATRRALKHWTQILVLFIGIFAAGSSAVLQIS